MAAARRGALADAEHLARELLASATEVSLIARLSNLLGGIAFEHGRLEEAELWLEQVIRSPGAAQDPLLTARATNNLASIAHLRGKRTLALSLYRSALLAWQREKNVLGEAQTCHNLGIVAREEGTLLEAAEYADRAVLAAQRTEDPALLSLVLMGRVEVSLVREVWDAALRDLVTARELAGRTGDALGCAEADRLGGRIALAQGLPEEALRQARLGYRRANRLGAVQLAGECAELCTRASQELRQAALVARYRATARRHYAALGARPSLRRLSTEASR